MRSFRNAFPVNDIPIEIRDFVLELVNNLQVPVEMAFASVMVAISTACQFRVKVRRMDGKETVCGLYFVTVADSGERKTTLDNHALEGIRDFDDEQYDKFRKDMEEYNFQHRIWESECTGFLNLLKKIVAKGEDPGPIKRRIDEHRLQEPKRPRLCKNIYQDVTIPALLDGLHRNSTSVAIISDEAGDILKGPLARDLSTLNKLWGGLNLPVDRKSTESFVIKDGRATIGWQVQSKIFESYLKQKGDEARGIGFLARCFISYPQSTQGSRYRNNFVTSWEHKTKFQQRIKELLADGIGKEGANNSLVLRLSGTSEDELLNVYNTVEKQLGPTGFFRDSRDYGSKVVENIIRMSALFHFFCGGEGDIPVYLVKLATSISHWYAQEFVDLFSPPGPFDEMRYDVGLLEDWLAKMHGSTRMFYFEKNKILQYGPRRLRNAKRLNEVLNTLASFNRIRLDTLGREVIVHIRSTRYTGGMPIPEYTPLPKAISYLDPCKG